MIASPVQTCKRCLYNTNHPLGLVIDSEGICSGCRVHEEKDRLDWANRCQRLEQLLKPYRSRDSRIYDCIVPVSGAGDSFFIVHMVIERLCLKPLLVTYNRYYNTPLGIRNLARLRTRFNCDILIKSVNPINVKRIVRTTLNTIGSIQWAAIAGQTAFPVQTAVALKVPLVVWGAHQGLEQVGMFSHQNEVEMTRLYRKEHDLMGYEADDLLGTNSILTEQDIWQFRYPCESSIESIGVRGIYLGNYVRWDQLVQHQLMRRIAGYKGARTSRTFDTYDHVDDWHYMGIHDILKVNKHGYGKVLDHACREIRHGRISRECALNTVNHYTKKIPENLDLFQGWLNIGDKELRFLIDMHRSTAKENQPHKETGGKQDVDISGYTVDTTLDHMAERRTITIGKGVDNE